MFKKYKPEFDYTYTLGTFPTLELLRHKPQEVVKVFVHSSAVESEGVSEVYKLCDEHNIEIVVSDKQIATLSLKENIHTLAIFNKYQDKLDDEQNHLLLMNPADMGNLGTIMRSMVSFDNLNLAIIKPAADVFHPRAVRSSMGAMFMLNVEYFEDFAAYNNRFPAHNKHPFMLDGKQELSEVEFQAPYTLIFGNESSGLAPEFQNAGSSVYINQSPNTDSLNLAISVGIALYESA